MCCVYLSVDNHGLRTYPFKHYKDEVASLSCVYAWDFYFVTIMVCNDLIISNLLSAKNKQTCWFVVLKCERLLLLTLVVLVCLKTPVMDFVFLHCPQHTWHCWIIVVVENLSFKLYVWHNGIFLDFRGLLSEKSDDSLFFLDVGQPKKVEEKGKLVSLSSKALYFYPLIYIILFKKCTWTSW